MGRDIENTSAGSPQARQRSSRLRFTATLRATCPRYDAIASTVSPESSATAGRPGYAGGTQRAIDDQHRNERCVRGHSSNLLRHNSGFIRDWWSGSMCRARRARASAVTVLVGRHGRRVRRGPSFVCVMGATAGPISRSSEIAIDRIAQPAVHELAAAGNQMESAPGQPQGAPEVGQCSPPTLGRPTC